MRKQTKHSAAYVVAPDRDGKHLDDLANTPPETDGEPKSTAMKVKKARSSKNLSKREATMTPRRVLHLLRRVAIFGVAILYLHVSISASIDSVHVLRGAPNPSMDFVPYDAFLMATYAGTTTMRQSPLVTRVLSDDTSPRTDTVYLEDDTTVSFDTCTQVEELPDVIYTNAYQREVFDQFVRDTSYNITLLDPSKLELIVLVVDCTGSSIAYQDLSAVRFFYLLRSVANHDDVYLLSINLSVQEYKIDDRDEHGSASVSTLAFLNDLQATAVTHHFVVAIGTPFFRAAFEVYELVRVTTESFWELQSVPADATQTPARLETACRTGFYRSSDMEQSNIKNTLWNLAQEPVRVITAWEWLGRPVLRDSWAWTHCLHAVLALDVFVNLAVLLSVVLRNVRNGTLWVGDAFVSVSTSLWIRCVLVLLSWYLDAFWALIEFCIHEGNTVSETQGIFIYPSIMRADLLALFFCIAAVIGTVLKERIDPALTIGVFYVGFESRLAIAARFPSIVATLTEYVVADYGLAMSDDESAAISPLRVWSSHELVKPNAAFVMAALFPVFSPFVVIIAYVAARKVYRYFVPEKLVVQRLTGFSEDEEHLLELKRNLTLFEIATGAALQSRYGVVADYDNCIYIRGVKFASADGIYSSGYVIANGKLLVQTEDLVSIWLMKLLHKRFRNVYVYEVDGTSVKQQARLVYPETIAIQDLLVLNINVLS